MDLAFARRINARSALQAASIDYPSLIAQLAARQATSPTARAVSNAEKNRIVANAFQSSVSFNCRTLAHIVSSHKPL